MTGVQRCHRVALLKRRGTDQQIIGWQRDARRCLLAADLTGDFRCAVRDWMHRYVLLQFIDERAACDSDLGCVGAGHSVDQFSKRDRRDRNLDFSEGLPHGREQLLDRLPLSFCCDDYAGIENQSQEGGFHGWLRSLMPSSTSLPKSPSKIVFEPLALADAMHSEIGRPERFGDLIDATGRWSRSTITSTPSSTFARTAYGSRARSASLM